jgi:hypothetical protein
MPNHTFPCPFCGKKMGVGHELLGKKVRCPHCNQILMAPAPSAASPPPVPAPKPPEMPADLPVFNFPKQEARESIFGEQEDEGDDVFSSSESTKIRIPELPVEYKSPPVKPVSSSPSMTKDATIEPTVEMQSPFSGVAAPPLPPPSPPVPTIAPIGDKPSTAAGNNPWAGMDKVAGQPAETAVPTLVPIPLPETESPFSDVNERKANHKKPAREEDGPFNRSRGGAAMQSPLFKIGFFILAPYALIMTVLAIYGLFVKSSTPPGHPLATVPDNFGEFAPAERKKSGRLLVPVDGEIPPDQRVALGPGNKLDIGQLEIEPLRVEQRSLTLVTEGKTAKEKEVQQTLAPALVLHLRIKNTSGDMLIYPLDPAFNRKPVGNDHVATGIMIGKIGYWGGAVAWPFRDRVNRVYDSAQETDWTPLKPGESREYVVFTDASQRIVRAVHEAKDSILWRVQLRRGRIDFDGKDLPVTAIIGVEFRASDVKED